MSAAMARRLLGPIGECRGYQGILPPPWINPVEIAGQPVTVARALRVAVGGLYLRLYFYPGSGDDRHHVCFAASR